MGIIRIIKDNIELDIVKESLSVKKENNAFIDDFKISHNSYPFLIVENINTKAALGTREISSVNKKKVIPVVVIEAGQRYYGELTVLSYPVGYRKCDLKYGSALIAIMSKKIAEFMPVVSVIPGETEPVPFSEENPEEVAGAANWQTYPVNFIDKGYPDVKWNFPTMVWLNKFGEDLDETDPWRYYEGQINRFSEGLDEFISNYYEDVEGNVVLYNRNVPSPQVYLLAPLYYALASIGYKANGSFTTSDFIMRLLMLSTKDNLCKVNILPEAQEMVFEEDWVYVPPLFSGGDYYKKQASVPLSAAGSYVLRYRFDIRGPHPFTFNGAKLLLSLPGQNIMVYDHPILPSAHNVFEGELAVTVSEPGAAVLIMYSKWEEDPWSFAADFVLDEGREFNQMHPTIEFGRYVPDWTFAQYLNEIKKLFNLDIEFDDLSQRLKLDFSESNLIAGASEPLKKDLEISTYDNYQVAAYVLKYGNEDDAYLYIDLEGIRENYTEESDFLQTISAAFKYVPVTYTAVLTDELSDRDGTGLMLYDPLQRPYIKGDYNGQDLSIADIYNAYHKTWVKMLLRSSFVEVEGPFTEVELNRILNTKKVYFSHQLFAVRQSEYSETLQGTYLVKLSLVSIVF